MKVDVLLGLQWGDEGKGKIVDYLAPRYHVVARFQGGPNAGHTLEFDGIKHVLHQIPSGIFRKNIVNIIGNGVVLDPVTFQQEVKDLEKLQVNPRENLFVSTRAQLILPTHRALDMAYEKAKGKDKIGSTLKGIGPAYQDKVSRQGLRVGDIKLADFAVRYAKQRDRHLQILRHLKYEYDFEKEEKTFLKAIGFLKSFVLSDTEHLINEKLQEHNTVLAEGAQGTMLDVDFGSYPFVTSSNTITAGACTGLGVPPLAIGEVYGIFKSYCTRVGSGPFPTELHDETGEQLRDYGHEFGATTGRPRRTGWLDLPALKYAVMINGVTQLFMMKADVLGAFKEIKICTGYRLPDGNVVDKLSYNLMFAEVEPVYKTFESWGELTAIPDSLEELPFQLKRYVRYIEEQVGVPVTLVSLGPDRQQTVM